MALSVLAVVGSRPSLSIAADGGPPVSAIGTVTVGRDPSEIAIDPSAGIVYVANRKSDSVSLIDERTREVVATIPVGSEPAAVAVDTAAHLAYVADSGGDTLAVVDGARRRVATTITIGHAPDVVAVDSSTHRVYVADQGTVPSCYGVCDDTIRALNGQTGRQLAATSAGGWVVGMVVDEAAHTLAVVSTGKYQSDPLVALLAPSLQELAVDRPNYWTAGVAVDPRTHRVFAGVLLQTLLGLDPLPGQVPSFHTTRIAVGVGPHHIAVDPSTATVYVANGSSHTVTVVDERINRVTATVPVGAPSTAYFTTANSGPGAIAVDPRTHQVYVADRGGDSVMILQGISAVRSSATPALTPAMPHTGGGGGWQQHAGR